jgi:hypothetical protein
MGRICRNTGRLNERRGQIDKWPSHVAYGIALLLGVLLLVRSSGAQSTVGNILGTVSDPSGAVIAGVNVTVTNTATGISRTATSDETGSYKILRLLPSTYTITAEMAGFKKVVLSGITLQVNQDARYDIRLEVGELTQEVSVSAEGVVVQTDDATLGQVVDQQKVVELPLNGRNFMQLVAIGTGAVPIQTSQGGSITGETKREGLSFSISGQREVSMSYLVDGIETRSEMFQMAGMQVSLDAIQEFKLQRNAFSAEFGGASAVVNLAVKSGTNQFHGSAFEFLRNDALDAAQFQDPVVNGKKENPPFRMNQFGGSFGGPIFKNKTFFFGAYEGFRRTRFAQFQASAIPNRVRGGDFSTLRDASGNLIPIYDPLTYDPATGTRQQFPGNVIPAGRIDPLAKQLLQYAPPPQNESAPRGQINTTEARNRKRSDDQIHVRIDHNLSPSTTIFGRYSWFDSPILDPLGYAPASTQNFYQKAKNLAVGVTHTVSPRTINEFRLGYNKDRSDSIPDWDGSNITEELGIKNLNPVPQQYGIPAFSGVTFTGAGPFGWDIVSTGTVFQYSDVLTLIRGAHTVKLGGEVRDMRPWAMAEDTGRRGTYSFTGQFTGQLQSGAVVPNTGDSIADFLLGVPQRAQGSTGSTYTEFDWTHYHGFVQDDWKVAPNFTLSMGLRYEFNMQGDPRDGKLEAFCADCIVNGQRGDLLLTDRPNVEGKQLRRQVVDPDYNNFSPRLGFAWTPFGSKDTVLRGGFGIFYENTKGDEMNFRQHHPDKTQLSEPFNENPTPTFYMGRDSFPPTTPGFNANPFTVDPNDRWPYVMQWNMNVQRKLSKDWLLEVGYVGSHGNKLSKRWNLNQATLDPDPLNPTPLKSRQPYPRFNTVLGSFKAGISNYNSMQVRIEKNFSNGFYLLSGYTFSRCQDMDSSAGFAADNQNVFNRSDDYGLCGFHVKNRANASLGWKLPFGEGLTGFAGKLAKGWQINSIIQLQDGMPLTPSRPGDPARVGARYLPRFNRTCDGNLPDSQQSVLRFFDTSCFVPAPDGTFGNSGRNVIFGPGFKTVDFSIFKNTYITETVYVQFRAEVFNGFNHSNYDQVSGGQGPNFGRIFNEKDARELQFGLKIIF